MFYVNINIEICHDMGHEVDFFFKHPNGVSVLYIFRVPNGMN